MVEPKSLTLLKQPRSVNIFSNIFRSLSDRKSTITLQHKYYNVLNCYQTICFIQLSFWARIEMKVSDIPDEVLDNSTTVRRSLYNPRCTFYDYALQSRGENAWSTDGCTTILTDNGELNCQCNHLTSFAVLMVSGWFFELSTIQCCILSLRINFVFLRVRRIYPEIKCLEKNLTHFVIWNTFLD